MSNDVCELRNSSEIAHIDINERVVETMMMTIEQLKSNETIPVGLRCTYENCAETFMRMVDLHKHLFYAHNKVKQECPICHEKFLTNKLLRLHEKTHGDYECVICGQRFNEKSYLKLHLKNHDENREAFACDLCGKKFRHKCNLRTHRKTIHEKKKFRCVLCDRELSTKQKLDHHMEKRHKAIEENLEIDLGELDKFEKEWNAKHGPPQHDEDDTTNFNIADCDLELLYN